MAKKASEGTAGKKPGKRTTGGEGFITVKLPVTTRGIYVVDASSSKKKPKVQLF